MLNARSTVIEDIYQDSRIPAEAYRPTFVKSLAMVPVRRDAPIGAIGNYWASQRIPTEQEVAILQALADTTSVALENAELYMRLKAQVETLQAQQIRIRAQNESLQVFTRALSHDLKEPVRTMKAFSGLIASEEPVSEEGRTYVRLIGEASDRMAMLIDTVFQYTQLDDPLLISKSPCEMNAMLKAARDNLSKLIGDRKAEIVAGPLPDILANPAQMMQVLQNLIANAIKHNAKPVRIEINAELTGNHWRFCVRDNGEGIAPEFVSKIFEPFRRLSTQDDNTGLGLAICQKIVTSYGGKMWCESTSGNGATFYFTLPSANVTELPAAEEDAEFISTDLANVLLVDDREADILLTKVTLIKRDRLQCNLSIAKDADTAFDMLTEANRKGEDIDLILLDINMPQINGFELLQRLRADNTLKSTAVIMCTGSLYEPDRQNAENLGAVGYMIKPPSFDQLKPVLKLIPSLKVQAEGKSHKLLRAS